MSYPNPCGRLCLDGSENIVLLSDIESAHVNFSVTVILAAAGGVPRERRGINSPVGSLRDGEGSINIDPSEPVVQVSRI